MCPSPERLVPDVFGLLGLAPIGDWQRSRTRQNRVVIAVNHSGEIATSHASITFSVPVRIRTPTAIIRAPSRYLPTTPALIRVLRTRIIAVREQWPTSTSGSAAPTPNKAITPATLGELPALTGQRGGCPQRGANARSPDEPKQEPHGKLSGQTIEAEAGNDPVAEHAQGR